MEKKQETMASPFVDSPDVAAIIDRCRRDFKDTCDEDEDCDEMESEWNLIFSTKHLIE